MATRTREDRRLRLLSAVCLALPETERTLCGPHADFRVHGKIFAYYLKNHGGDGIVAACVKARLGEHVQHVERAPQRFYLPQFIGRRGWFGVRLDQGEIDWDEVKALVAVSYNLAVPRNLRTAFAPLANSLTARSLVRGAPPPELAAAPLVAANLLNTARLAEEHRQGDTALPPPALPGGTSIRQSVGVRSRR
jgi:predicted DNA-binding protein (MmcQ/YjbR family)